MFFKKKEKAIISFHAKEEILKVIPHPVPAAKLMPEWFRKLKPMIKSQDQTQAGTVKRCMPVLDAVTQGYIIPLWADFHVRVTTAVNVYGEDDELLAEIDYIGDEQLLVGTTMLELENNPLIARATRDGSRGLFMKFPEVDLGTGELLSGHHWDQVGNACDLKRFKFGKQLTKFTNPWVIKTPKGWSVQIKNPSNNFSNDIQILEGVVDTDEYYNEINFPFVWSGDEDMELIIPQGTPLIHVIPFKRIETELEVGVTDEKLKALTTHKMFTKHIDRYKSIFWNKRKK